MPSLGCHVPEDSPLYAAAQARAQERHAGKVSAYVRSLIERDLAGSTAVPPAADPRFLEKLFTAVLPSRVSRFQRLWDTKTKLSEAPFTQSEVAEVLLTTLLKLMEADPTADLIRAFDALPQALHDALIAAKDGDTAALGRDPHITPYLQPEAPSQHVAEPQSPYGGKIPKPPPYKRASGSP